MREIALGLARRGHDVEVLTTTAVDHHTWASALPPGEFREDGLPVTRFATVPNRSYNGERAQGSAHYGRPVPMDEQIDWLSFPFRVPDLFMHLVAEGSGYRAVVFAPYLFWTTTVCMPVVAERAVVMPCLHDEPYARLDVIRPVLQEPAAVWFLSEPEHQLAHRLGPVSARHRVTGAGLDAPAGYDPEGFRARHGVGRPFILFAGRRELGKGWDWLLSCFATALEVDDTGVDLVTIGSGAVEVPAALKGRVIDLGFLPTAERDNAFAAALAYVQPSLMESFSRSIMESWLAGTPVLARTGSEVVAWHCERSGGGHTFDGGRELATRLRSLIDDPAGAAGTAAAGRRYVLENYTWDVVLDRMEEDLA
jgi:glycosyltransferase involved in cell wall biosynthesis